MSATAEWARCRPWIKAALDKGLGFETIEDVERLIRDCVYQFWPGKRAAAITQIVPYARAKVLIVRTGGGDLAELIEMEKEFCRFARANGCSKIMGEGREGWQRVCEKMNYRLGYVCMVKDLT